MGKLRVHSGQGWPCPLPPPPPTDGPCPRRLSRVLAAGHRADSKPTGPCHKVQAVFPTPPPHCERAPRAVHTPPPPPVHRCALTQQAHSDTHMVAPISVRTHVTRRARAGWQVEALSPPLTLGAGSCHPLLTHQALLPPGRQVPQEGGRGGRPGRGVPFPPHL